MSEDINVNALAEAINDKMDRDGNNVDTTSGADSVIAYQVPTAENDYKWYRLYASGWVEQGGCVNTASGTVTVNFPITMSDSNYTILKTIQTNSTAAPARYFDFSFANKTTTSADTNTASVGFSWQVSGMAALSAINPIGLLENTMKKVVDGEGIVDTTKLNSAETSIASFLNI